VVAAPLRSTLLVVLIAGAGLAAARRGLLVVRVVGDSMAPALPAGGRVLVRRGSWGVRRGSVVVGRPPRLPGAIFVKRVTAVGGQRVAGLPGVVPRGHCWVQGDGAVSGDSRVWGPVRVGDLLGVMVARLPSARAQPSTPA